MGVLSGSVVDSAVVVEDMLEVVVGGELTLIIEYPTVTVSVLGDGAVVITIVSVLLAPSTVCVETT